MDLQQFLSRPSGSFSEAFKSRHFNPNLSEDVRQLANWGLKLFPVSLAAKLAGDSNQLITNATDDATLLDEMTAAVKPVWGYRIALGPSGLCVLVLDGAVGGTSFAALVPDLDDCLTLRARRGDVVYAFFRQPAGMARITTSRKLAPSVTVLGDDVGFDVPPAGGANWLNPGTEIEALPHVLRELLAPDDPPDSPPGHATPTPQPSPRSVPCRHATRLPRPNQGLRKGHPVCNQASWRRGGYRIYRQR